MPPWYHRITNKHIIVAQSNGQIYDLDLLQVHPRRPTTDPTLAGDGQMRRPDPFRGTVSLYARRMYECDFQKLSLVTCWPNIF